MADLIIAHATVITMDAKRRVIEDGAVAIAGSRIIGVGSTAEITERHSATRTIDATHKLVMPGMIDCHAHAGHGLIKTMGGGDSQAWFEAVGKVYHTGTSPEFWHAEAMLSAVERVKCGVTTGMSFLGGGDSIMRTDDAIFGGKVCEAVEQVGNRVFLAVGSGRPPFPRTFARWDNGKRSETQVTFERQMEVSEELIRAWHGQADGRINICTSLPVFQPEDVVNGKWNLDEIRHQSREVRALGRKHALRFTQDGHRKNTIKFAHKHLDILGPDAIMSHSVDLLPEEIALCRETETVICHNPSAIMSIRGRCPVPELIEAGVTVVLGSDGTAPDRGYDMFRHGWQAMHYHRRHFRDEKVLPPGKILEMLTIDAAKALGLEQQIGSVEAGKQADLIVIDMFKPHLYPPNMPVHRIAYFANGADVDTVLVNGRIVMEGRVMQTVDERAVLETAAREAELMLDRNDLRSAVREPAAIWGHARL